MEEPRNDIPISELQCLRAPARAEPERRQAVERILEAAAPILDRRKQPSSSWDVLANWARPGLVAASVALAILAGAVHFGAPAEPPPVALDDVLVGGGAVLAVLVATSEPDADAVVAAALFESTEPARPVDSEANIEQR